MADLVLIVTSSPGLGEVVRRTLVESGRYEVLLSTNLPEAIQHAQANPISIAILDVDLDKDMSAASLKKLGVSLREINPGIHILALSSSNDPYDPSIKIFMPEGIITTPLYPSSILRTIDRVSGIPSASPPPHVPPNETSVQHEQQKHEDGVPVWLQDVTRAAQHLTRLSLETASQAALIVSEERLWAYAGELPQPAAQELAETVVHYWGRNGESDLARFVQLDSDGGEYLLYATALGRGMVLALVFGVETPFSKIRSQVVNLARMLASPPANETGMGNALDERGRFSRGQSDALAGDRVEETRQGPLFHDIPPPSPEPWQQVPGTPLWGASGKEPHSEYPEAVHQPVGQGSLSSQPAGPASPELEMPGNRLSEMEAWGMMPASTGVYSLTYGILLIPRLPNHHIVGDLAERLPLWVSQLCVAFDWRLEHISVRPDYLQWNASTAPDIPPVQIVRNIRKHTSQRIFDEFPVLLRENPSGDFWATGFLLITGSQPPSGKLVQEFIRQIRHRQGITRPVYR